MRHLLLWILVILIGVTIFACGGSDEDNSTPEQVETPELVETVDPAETPEPMETPDPVETPEPMETVDPAETPETTDNIDLDNPLPNITDDGAIYVAPRQAVVDDSVAVEDAPEGFRWIMATATLSNQSESITITVDEADIFLIGDDLERYSPQEMAERVSPQLVGTTLAPGDSVIGFALFALPEDVAPVLFEWCPDSACDETPLQAQINFQE